MLVKFIDILFDQLRNSTVLKYSVRWADDALDGMNKHYQHSSIELNELVAKLSSDTDRLILEIQRKENLEFVGGELQVSHQAQQKDNFSLKLKLFLKNEVQAVILKETYKELDLSFLSLDSQQELQTKLMISYVVHAPKK